MTKKERRQQVAAEYLSGRMEREKAAEELGADTVEELDYALKSIDSDVEWGAKPCPKVLLPSLPQTP